ncbi:MAG: hypothetical protein U0802_19095 [Candidatus Binatia bacterium]
MLGGLPYATVEFEAPPRFAGYTWHSLMRMISFARTGLISFSKVPPAKLAVVAGFASALSLLYGRTLPLLYPSSVPSSSAGPRLCWSGPSSADASSSLG